MASSINRPQDQKGPMALWLIQVHLELLLLLLQPYYDPLSGTTQVSRYQNDKPFWILLKQTWWGGSGISWSICKLFALCSRRYPRQHFISQVFTGRMLFLTPNQQRQSTEDCSKHWSFIWKMTVKLVCLHFGALLSMHPVTLHTLTIYISKNVQMRI